MSMPLLPGSSPFKSHIKIPLRKPNTGSTPNLGLVEEEQKNNKINLKLGEQLLAFEEGEWVPMSVSGPGSNLAQKNQQVKRLQAQVNELTEENNLLNLKMEILLDMLAANAADYTVLEKEVEGLQRIKTSGRPK